MDNIILVPEALEVVKSNENISVLAGPGSGKTELLAQRIAFLLQTGMCPFPFRILALSFKRDSATNLEQRALKRCGVELASRFDSYTIDAFAKSILDRFRLALSEEIRPIQNYIIPNNSDQVDNKEYLDFPCIRKFAIQIIKNNKHVKTAIRQTYRFVLLDEFQDTTSTQYQLIKLSFENSSSVLTAVGDIKQSIMVFAGAKKRIFSEYEKDFTATRIPLLINYRSTKKLQYIQSFFAKKLDENVEIKTEYKDNQDGNCQILHFRDSDREADIIASEIQKYIEKGIQIEDICILYRRKYIFQSKDIYREKIMNKLRILGIPARFEDIYQNFLSEPIIKLIICFIRLSLKDQSHEDWNIIQNLLIYLKGFNEETHTKRFRDLNMMIFNKTTQIKNLFSKIKSKKDLWGICVMIIKLFRIEELSSLYHQYLDKNYLKKILQEFLNYFFQQYQLHKDWISALESLLGKGIIPIMTIHKSKGLEFDVVIFIGLENRAFFSYRQDPHGELCNFFVALSRAKKYNIFTHCDIRYSQPQSITAINEIYKIFRESGVKPISI